VWNVILQPLISFASDGVNAPFASGSGECTTIVGGPTWITCMGMLNARDRAKI
jgi:hypothetical protein